MKKSNLIGWLSRNSHEKQTPQRFGRYAVMLLMLLTIGVGQMWGWQAACNMYVIGDPIGGDWTNSSTSYQIATAYGEQDKFYIVVFMETNQYFALSDGSSNRYAPSVEHTQLGIGTPAVQGDYNHNTYSWQYTGPTGLVKICIDQYQMDNTHYPRVWVEKYWDPKDDINAVLTGSKVMFYWGDQYNDGWKSLYNTSNSSETAFWLAERTGSFYVSGSDWTGFRWGAACLSPARYYIRRASEYYAVQLPEDPVAGKGYMVYYNNGHTICVGDNRSMATFTNSGSYTIEYGTANSGVSASIPVGTPTSVIGKTNSIYGYYISVHDANSWSSFDPSDADEIAPGTYDVAAIVTDGVIYVKGATATLTVTETTYTVTVAAGANGSITSSTSVSAGAYTAPTISAQADDGYYFTGWTVTSGTAEFADASSASTTVNASSDATVTANFAPIWAICGSYASTASNVPAGAEGFGGWSVDNSTCLIENISTSAGKTYGYKIVALEANTNYQFKMRNREEPNWYGNNNSTQYMLYTPDEKHTNWDFHTEKENCGITTAGAGNYSFTWNLTEKKLTVTYPVSYTVTFGYGTGGSIVTASGSASGGITSGEYVASGEDVTFTQTPHAGYSFKGWYTTSDGNTAVTGMTTSDNVFDNITDNATVYAQYNPITYEITFDAVTNDGSITEEGSTSDGKISATYDAAVSGTMPTAQRDGYHFNGWYTAPSGGNQVIAADGTWQNNVDGYTDGSGHWVKADDATLYAQYSIGISGISFSPSSVLPSEEVTITTSFTDSKNPEGSYSFCYKLTTGAGIAMQVQPTFTADGLSATFEAPGTPGSYSVEVRLYDEANHNCATEDGSIASYTSHGRTFTVEATNAVTVEYKCGNVELRPSTIVQATASQRAVSVTAPEISGLTFTGWTRGANVTRASGDNDNVNPISIYASAASTLTANYSQSGYVYFKNTLGWSHVYLYKYNDNNYWDSDGPTDYGTGAHKDSGWGSRCTDGPLEMSLVDGTDDLYAVKPTNGAPSSGQSFVFTNSPSEEDFFGANGGYIDVVRVTTNYDATNPMVVPNKDGNTSEFYSHAKYYLNYFVAPALPDWSWTLRGAWTGNSDWTDPNQYFHFKAPKMGSLSFQTKRYFDAAGQSKDICLFDHRDYHYGVYNMDIYYNTNNPSDAIETGVDMNMHMHTNAPGDYIFTLTYMHSNNQTGGFPGKIRLAVTFPILAGDYRLVYTPGGGAHDHPGDVIKKRPNGLDTISLYVALDKSDKIYIQSCTSVDNTSVTWGTATAATYSNSNVFTNDTITKYGPGAYNFIVQQDANGANPTIIKVEKYTGRFYVRTNCIADKWNYKDSKDAHAMTYSEYSTTNALAADKQFSHYYVKDLDNGTNIKFTVANDYSEAISDTVVNGDAAGSWADIFGDQNLNRKMNVRFTYNQKTNKVWRAYTEGPIFNEYMVLRSDGTHVFKDNAGTKGVAKDTLVFSDLGNWVYQIDAWVTLDKVSETYYKPTFVKLTSGVHDQARTLQTQYLKGSSGSGTDGIEYTADDAVQILGGNSDQAQHMRITYDFKTDRMITSWLPIANISGELEIDADVMLIRTHQNAGQSITFANNSSSIKNVKKVYGVMQFDKATINNPAISRYARDLFWISFPFDVKLSDVFGMGTYGTHWIIEYYDGKGRAEHGFWADSDPNWKFVLPSMRDTFKLKANEGYILALDLDELGNSSSVWTNVTTAYLYFPSSVDMNTISTASTKEFDINQTGYLCNITRDSRNIKDSYWHCIGAPSFAGASHNLTNDYTSGDVPNMPETWTAENMPFLYEWNSTSNTLSPKKTSSFTFDAMHSYLVQYGFNKITWTNIIVHSVAARVTQMPDREYNLTMLRDSVEEDHTYVRLTDDEGISQAFEFNYDLSKEYNAGKGNIWTVTTDEIPVAGNSQPHPLTTTVVPVGVKIAANGEYTFSMPEGTNGGDVWLIDNANSSRTNLGLMDYTITLTTGTYEGRFSLEFPVQNVVTEIENAANANANADIRKVFVGGRLYILRDGKAYDATGAQVR